ncbi:MAG: GNAT family N-acetyltransferase [Actinobacteria bacterium]|nr:GNAT family N-acetyltransferase [Actinomycetota bacterium]
MMAAPSAITPELISWVHEAANPYFDWVFGDPSTARAAVTAWLARPTSEIAAARVRPHMVHGEVVGGHVALSGVELAVARKADAAAMLKVPGDRAALLHRLAVVRDLFAPVESDEWYLSKLGVLPAFRGRGLGGTILDDYLAAGAALGFHRYRLDVCADNPAVTLYERVGFAVVSKATSETAGMTYLAMARDDR